MEVITQRQEDKAAGYVKEARTKTEIHSVFFFFFPLPTHFSKGVVQEDTSEFGGMSVILN